MIGRPKKSLALRPLVRGIILAGVLMLAASAAAWPQPPAAAKLGAQEAPRLASLEIAVWPEFDRRAQALIILRARLAEDVPLPATLALHIPTSSGGPFAVASAPSQTDPLLTLDYGLAAAQDSLLLTISTPNPYFQIEFYEPLSIDTSSRSVTYVWPGDVAADAVTLEVQEPAGATEITTEPEMGEGTAGLDQLVYRSAEVGELEPGGTLTVSVSYVKTDLRTSLEVISPDGAGTVALTEESDDGFPLWAILLIAVAAVALAAAALGYWRWQSQPAGVRPRRPGSGAPRRREDAPPATFCPQCGERLHPGHRFCPACGAAARGK